LPDEEINDEENEVECHVQDQTTSHVGRVEVPEGNLERFLEIHDGSLTVLLLEVVDFVGHGHVQNIIEIVLLHTFCYVLIIDGAGIGMDEFQLWVRSVLPIKLLEILDVLEVPREGDRHAFVDGAVHDGLTGVDLLGPLGITFWDDDATRTVHHDSVERRLVALIMDLDIDRMLPVDVGVVVESRSDLGTDHVL